MRRGAAEAATGSNPALHGQPVLSSMNRQSSETLEGCLSVRTGAPLFATIAFIALSSFLLASCRRDAAAEADLQRRILGTWISTNTSSTGIVTTNITMIHRNGAFAERDNLKVGSADDPGGDLFDGCWQIRDGYLTYTVTNTSLPELVPLGHIARFKIVRLSDTELT